MYDGGADGSSEQNCPPSDAAPSPQKFQYNKYDKQSVGNKTMQIFLLLIPTKLYIRFLSDKANGKQTAAADHIRRQNIRAYNVLRTK